MDRYNLAARNVKTYLKNLRELNHGRFPPDLMEFIFISLDERIQPMWELKLGAVIEYTAFVEAGAEFLKRVPNITYAFMLRERVFRETRIFLRRTESRNCPPHDRPVIVRSLVHCCTTIKGILQAR